MLYGYRRILIVAGGKRQKRMGNKERNGFTLAELLVVVAIIGVLVGVSIPVFSGQLEKAREATDLANVRAAYAEVMSDAATETKTAGSTYDETTNRYTKTVKLKQKKTGWTTANPTVAGITPADKIHWQGEVLGDGDCTVYFEPKNQSVTLLWSGYSVKINYQWIQSGGRLSLSSRLSSQKWPASLIPNMIDVKANSGQSLVIGKLTEDGSPALWKATTAEGGSYHFEIGFFLTDADGNIAVDHGYEVLKADEAHSYAISTNASDLSQEAGADNKKVYDNVVLPDDGSCKLAIQIYKVNGDRSSCVELSDAEAAEITKLIEVE